MDIAITDRLLIAALTTASSAFILELVNSPGWLTYIGDRNIKTLADAEKYLIHGPIASYAANGFGLYEVSLKENGVPIGICGIIKRDTLDHPDIGFAFLPAYTGKGYAQEAAEAVLHYALYTLQLSPVLAITMESNQRSIRLLEKIGLAFKEKIILPGSDKELMLFSTTVG